MNNYNQESSDSEKAYKVSKASLPASLFSHFTETDQSLSSR